MKKKILFVFTSFAVLSGLLALGIIVLPYHSYYLAITEGLSNSYVDIPKFDERFYKGSSFELNESNMESDNDNWDLMSFEDFSYDTPIRNPLFRLAPHFMFLDLKDRPGLLIQASDKKIYLKSYPGGSEKINLNLAKDWVFELPYFKNYILSKGLNLIWKDLFTLNIDIPKTVEKAKQTSFFNYLNVITKLDARELVYKLYILKVRHKYFGEDTLNYHYVTNKDFYLIERPHLNSNYRQEEVHFFENGVIHKFYLWANKNKPLSDSLRLVVLNSLTYTPENKEKSIGIYSEFRNLEFREKVDQVGMLYLYSAWSLDQKRKEFMKEMIQFLERGKDNTNLLRPLYRYSLKHYQTTFSLRDENLSDSIELKERKEKEERIKELKRRVKLREYDQFESDKKKVDYYLNKAKEKNSKNKESDVIEIN